jgi:hypothetical protein
LKVHLSGKLDRSQSGNNIIVGKFNMPQTAENTSTGMDSTETKILSMTSFIVANGVLITSCSPHNEWRGKYYSIFINGRYVGQSYCPLTGLWQQSYVLDAGTQLSSFYVIEAGDWDGYENETSVLEGGAIPDGWVQEWENLHAHRLFIEWDSQYNYSSTPTGDTQLSGIVVTGASRWINMIQTETGTIGRIYYTVETIGTTHYVNWWKNQTLLARGSRTGDGYIKCDPINSSGLIIEAVLTYTADIGPMTGFIDIIYPSSFQVHYSLNPLTYPRTPEATVQDDGISTHYSYLSPVLTGSSYNYNVLAVNANGVTQASTTAPSDSPKILYQGPKSPTITGVTGTYADPVVTWTEGQSNCYYTVYSSYPNQAINFGRYHTPVEIVTGIGDTSQQLAPIVNWQPVDRQPYIDTLLASCDSAVSTLTTAFAAGSAGFSAAWTTFDLAIETAVKLFGEQIEYNVHPLIVAMNKVDTQMLGMIQFATAYTGTGWSDFVGPILAQTLQSYGSFINNEPDRWNVSGYTPSIGGEEGGYPELNYSNDSVISLCDPIVKPATVCVVVRATDNATGIQEAGDQEYCFEIDENGDVVPPRPNQAFIESWSHTGLKLTVKGLYLVSDERAEPNQLILCLVPTGTTINPATPVTTATLGSETLGERRATLTYTVAASGYYDIAVLAKNSTTGGISGTYLIKTVRIDNFAPDGVDNLKATVMRGEQ